MKGIHSKLSGSVEIAATSNGVATGKTAFPSQDRKAFNGLALAIVRAKKGATGTITLKAASDGLADAATTITSK